MNGLSLTDRAGFDDTALERMRQATTPLVLALPSDVPGGVLAAPPGLEEAWTVLKVLAASAAHAARQEDWTTVLALARAAALHLPAAAAHAVAPTAQQGRRPGPGAYDAMFRIGRAGKGDSAGYIRGLAMALVVFLEEADTRDTLHAYAPVGQVLAALWSAVLDVDTRHAAAVVHPKDDQVALAPASRNRSAHRRWLRGYQVQTALLQGLAWSLRSLPSGLGGDDAQTAAALRRVSRTYQAAERALGFANDAAIHLPGVGEGQAARAAGVWTPPDARSVPPSAELRAVETVLATRRSALLRAEERCPAEFGELARAQQAFELRVAGEAPPPGAPGHG